MIATLIFFNKHVAARTSLPVYKILLKIYVAWPSMFFKHTLRTIFNFTLLTVIDIFANVNNSVTFFFWTQSIVRIVYRLFPNF